MLPKDALALFEDVLDVTTRNMKGKIKTMGRYKGKRPDSKRAIVKLAPGEKIEIFSSLQ